MSTATIERTNPTLTTRPLLRPIAPSPFIRATETMAEIEATQQCLYRTWRWLGECEGINAELIAEMRANETAYIRRLEILHRRHAQAVAEWTVEIADAAQRMEVA